MLDPDCVVTGIWATQSSFGAAVLSAGLAGLTAALRSVTLGNPYWVEMRLPSSVS